MLAIGWEQGLPILHADARKLLVEPDGQWRLHRWMVNPDLPDLGFVGFNSSFVSALSAELGAHWLARHMDGALAWQPTDTAMRAGIARPLEWKRAGRKVATTFGRLCVAPYHHAHFDELMADMGARRKRNGVLAAHFAPIDPEAYAELLASARNRVPAAGDAVPWRWQGPTPPDGTAPSATGRDRGRMGGKRPERPLPPTS